jgi:transcriptional regulator with XRE-family HTH domain
VTAKAFTKWAAQMRTAHDLSEQQLARLLGCGHNQISRWKRTGAPLYIELACEALTHRLEEAVNA